MLRCDGITGCCLSLCMWCLQTVQDKLNVWGVYIKCIQQNRPSIFCTTRPIIIKKEISKFDSTNSYSTFGNSFLITFLAKLYSTGFRTNIHLSYNCRLCFFYLFRKNKSLWKSSKRGPFYTGQEKEFTFFLISYKTWIFSLPKFCTKTSVMGAFT